MMLASQVSAPLLGLNDPVASLLHLGGAAWFAWQAQQLIQRAGGLRRRAVALAAFAGSAVAVLSISGTYHGLSIEHPSKWWMQRLDHAAIFLLIAGTVTSFHAVSFRGRGRLWMVGVVWAFTLGSIASVLSLWSDLSNGLELALYIALALVGASSLVFLPRILPWRAFAPLALGGLVYVAGALSDLWVSTWIIPHVLGPHELFHLAVLVALFLHWSFFHQWADPARLLAVIEPPATVGIPAAPEQWGNAPT